MLAIKRIANEFGYDLGQEFFYEGVRYKFTKDGLFWFTDEGKWKTTPEVLVTFVMDLLNSRGDVYIC